jgi:hypothetical protein
VEEDAFQGHWHDLWTSNAGVATTGSAGRLISGPGSPADALISPSDRVRGAVSDGINGTPRTADETRVKGLVYLWCIKAFDVISNPAILNAQAVVNQLNDKLDAAEIVAPGDAPKYVCRAWVNFDGTTTPPTIRASGNVSSVVRNATGDYTINFATPMQDANYTAAGSAQKDDTTDDGNMTVQIGGATSSPRTTTSIKLKSRYISSIEVRNSPNISLAIFR